MNIWVLTVRDFGKPPWTLASNLGLTLNTDYAVRRENKVLVSTPLLSDVCIAQGNYSEQPSVILEDSRPVWSQVVRFETAGPANRAAQRQAHEHKTNP